MVTATVELDSEIGFSARRKTFAQPLGKNEIPHRENCGCAEEKEQGQIVSEHSGKPIAAILAVRGVDSIAAREGMFLNCRLA